LGLICRPILVPNWTSDLKDCYQRCSLASSEPNTYGLNARSSLSRNEVIDEQHYDCANHRDEKTVDIKPADACHAEGVKQPPPNDRAYNSEDDVYNNALPALINDLAPDKTGNQAQYDPGND